jgi:hypothetical protein
MGGGVGDTEAVEELVDWEALVSDDVREAVDVMVRVSVVRTEVVTGMSLLPEWLWDTV